MFDDRSKAISEGLDWCINVLDTLRQLPPDTAALLGIDMVLGWKKALEHRILTNDRSADESPN